MLSAGTRLGPYEIQSAIGAGGMGEVYRAKDTRLDRTVAIKVLPAHLGSDPEFRERFQREARTISQLNHPHICVLHDVGEAAVRSAERPAPSADRVSYLVMEYVAGETLAERIASARGSTDPALQVRGRSGSSQPPIPLGEALTIARQVAEALEAAHDQGIVHRDLKPANIKITPTGQVKVLDFGLAKIAAAAPAADLASSPTLTARGTGAGRILGIAAYMSPEQARGRPVDKRADIWAFGCLLFELLAGRPAFPGETVSDVLAAILRQDPEWDALPASTPAFVLRLLRKCLQKDPRRRLHDIADARIDIEEALREPPVPQAQPTPVSSSRPGQARQARLILWLLSGVLASLAAVVLWGLLRPSREEPRSALRAALPLLPGSTVSLGRGAALALSPDGHRVVYVAASGPRVQLYLRGLDRFDATPIPGTEGATNPFFSPDGRWVGFFADGKLKKVALHGGAPVTIADAGNPRGESWAPDGTILFTPTGNSGLWRVPAAGGPRTVATTLRQGELSHRWPHVLPGGKAVLFTIWNDIGWEPARVAVQPLDGSERRMLIEGGGYGRYVPTGPDGAGHLVYARAEGLMAAPFSLERLEVTGPSVPVLEGVITNLSGGAHFSVSSNGTLAYLPGTMGEVERTLVWVDRQGGAQPLATIRGMSLTFRLSPDGTRLVRINSEGPSQDIWIHDLLRGASSRVTFGKDIQNAMWTPDGTRVTYGSGLPTRNLFWKRADGTGPEERLTTSPNNQFASS